jgi:hypothetical protein
MRVTPVLCCVVLVAGCSSDPEPAPKPAEPSADSGCCGTTVVTEANADQKKALWEPLTKLAGEWIAKGEDGKEFVGLSVKLSSGGTIIHETIFPGPNEMMNVYHMDGPSVLMTHYCHVGNQPRMRCSAVTANTWKFETDGCTNCTSKDGGFMGSMTLEVKDADHIRQSWFWHEKGKANPGPSFELTRKK